jgi:predicted lipid-binding transport protein (Tim44 family)
MTFDNKRVLSIALATALLGGTVGAFVSRSGKGATDTNATQGAAAPATAQVGANTTTPAATEQVAQNNPDAYREGFVDGVRTALENDKADEATSARTVTERETAQPARVVYRNSRRGSAGATTARYDNSRRVYYDYQQPQKRSFWQKHRDKLTVAAGAGGGAIIGGLIGGKKGAAIGALAGGGGSALYTYKLRKRNRNY